MGLLIRDDEYDESRRMVGFRRYKQLLSFHTGHWVKLGMLTFLGGLPLMLGITYAILSSSSLVALVAGVLGGIILGPFVAAHIDSLYRAMRDDSGMRWAGYRKGFRQNWKDSLLPGGLLGLFISTSVWLLYMSIYTDAFPLSHGTLVLLFVALGVFLIVSDLFWPQLVLFRQPLLQTIRNILLFTSKYLWMMGKICLLQILFLAFHLVFAPYTLVFLPFFSIWYFLFFSQFLLYDALNEELQIEEKYKTP
ncbi:MAG: hypothetical protein K6G04_05010 [Lachnospiraceae bacterium]|nr:hypothetical protein [Lachnospiraceae bacterium]